MLKQYLYIASLALVVLGVPAGAFAQASASNTASVTVEEQAITLTALDPLSFGTVLAFGRNGTVTVNPAGSTSVYDALSTAPGAPATYQVTGVPTAPFAVTLPVDNAVTVENGPYSMAVNGFSRSGGPQLYLDGAGEALFSVGAQLQVNARQPGGVYTGTFTVSVDYN